MVCLGGLARSWKKIPLIMFDIVGRRLATMHSSRACGHLLASSASESPLHVPRVLFRGVPSVPQPFRLHCRSLPFASSVLPCIRVVLAVTCLPYRPASLRCTFRGILVSRHSVRSVAGSLPLPLVSVRSPCIRVVLAVTCLLHLPASLRCTLRGLRLAAFRPFKLWILLPVLAEHRGCRHSAARHGTKKLLSQRARHTKVHRPLVHQ